MGVQTTANTTHLTRTTDVGLVGHARISACGWANYVSVVNDAFFFNAEHTSNGRSVNIGTPGSGNFSIGNSQTGHVAFSTNPPLGMWFYWAIVTHASGGPILGWWSPIGSDRWFRVSQAANGVEGSVQSERVSLFTTNGDTSNVRAHLENVIVWDRQSLTFQQIRAQKAQRKPIVNDGLYAWWKLESKASQLIDSSGKCRNLTATGTTQQGTTIAGRVPMVYRQRARHATAGGGGGGTVIPVVRHHMRMQGVA